MEKVQALGDLVSIVTRFLLLNLLPILGHMQKGLLRAEFQLSFNDASLTISPVTIGNIRIFSPYFFKNDPVSRIGSTVVWCGSDFLLLVLIKDEHSNQPWAIYFLGPKFGI